MGTPYVQQVWFDDEVGGTPTSADRFNWMETGIYNASQDAAAAGVQAIPTYASATARNTALPSPTDGTIVYLQDVDQFTARINGAWATVVTVGSSWTSYTPVWTGAGTSIGVGTLAGRFSKFGTTVHCNVTMVIGSNTTLGSNVGWSFSLPYTAVDLASYGRFTGTVYVRNNSPSQSYVGTCTIDDASGRLYPYTAAAYPAAAMIMSSSIPIGWAVGDVLSMSITYESTT